MGGLGAFVESIDLSDHELSNEHVTIILVRVDGRLSEASHQRDTEFLINRVSRGSRR